MIAKVTIQLPYSLTIPENEIFNIYSYTYLGYEIRIYPPVRSEHAYKYSDSENVTINGIKSFNADTLLIIFKKHEFDRSRSGQFDPPLKLIYDVANDFLKRLRYVTNASQIKPVDVKFANLFTSYLNDDESELPKDETLVKGRGTQKYFLQIVAFNKEVWTDIHSLIPFQELPIWKNLLLDANAILPDVGPSIVLTFTALEVFISKTLDDIASHKKVDNELWQWINDRNFFLKEPSIEEQFDFLSKYLIGKSIKENPKLWEAFKDLQKARNSFAHGGVPKIKQEIIDEDKARDFIVKAYQIINFLKEALPQELQWQDFKQNIKVEADIPFVKNDKKNS